MQNSNSGSMDIWYKISGYWMLLGNWWGKMLKGVKGSSKKWQCINIEV